jgi:hypothetical protein
MFVSLKTVSQCPLCYSKQTLAKVDLREKERKRETERERERERSPAHT